MVRYNKLYRLGHRLSEDPTATVRRVHALRAIGYSNASIATGTGLSQDYVRRLATKSHDLVLLPTARSVAEFYEAHHDRPASGPRAKKVKTWAAKAGFAPPASWDDITDLHEVPKGVRKK